MTAEINIQDKKTNSKLIDFIESQIFVRFIVTIIILNAITLGIETSKNLSETTYNILNIIDKIFISIFVVEISLKLIAYRLSFFKSGWNIFDLLIILISLIPASGPFSVIRALRIFRILRLISIVPQMRNVVAGLIYAIPGMTSVVLVLGLIFYVSSVLVTQIFGAYPDPKMQELYGDIGSSMFSLFQVMTLEGWSEGIAIPTMDIFPWSWAFFVLFIIITSFAVLNLFIGIIVEAMSSDNKPASKDDIENMEETETKDNIMVIEEISLLRKEISDLRKELSSK